MDTTSSNQHEPKLRLLVVIASYGEKNLDCLKNIIRTYRSMALEVDVIVLSNAGKDLGPGIKVVVGLPAKNPWSLPFGHKKIFADNADAYDLFIYSEDDMAVTERNIQAFLELTPRLAPDEIAGYLRYEVGPSGHWTLPEAHGPSHWKPESIQQRGSITVAEFSNEHAAFYLINRAQLKKSIASGGFLRAPCEGVYDMLCTAATDPYTICGFRKVICISSLEDFLIHHMTNRYAGQLGLTLDRVREQIQILQKISAKAHPASTLCEAESKFFHKRWSKSYDETPSHELLGMVPNGAATILSVGCGWGAAESEFKRRGAVVTALPLDSVVGAAVAQAGIEVIYGSFEQCLASLGDRKFDCVLLTDLLHLNSSPGDMLEACANLVGAGGTLVLGGPNFDFLKVLLKRLLRMGEFGQLSDYSKSGISLCGPGSLKSHFRKSNLRVDKVDWFNPSIAGGNGKAAEPKPGRFTARNWILRARRPAA
jgi:2-polyprenyl-3-methyl-5-hydroxy-6-metoxy-1,4-benzoquinol methylase